MELNEVCGCFRKLINRHDLQQPGVVLGMLGWCGETMGALIDKRWLCLGQVVWAATAGNVYFHCSVKGDGV